jgi:glycosyltransferase involved in cell wall biosynthesis
MPIYNRQNSIELSVTSVLHQNMNNFEIILVNDNSKDYSLKIMKKLKKADKRIKIINNNKNMGTLYSRCIAGLNAKGKYIFSLDPDDVFMDNDVFTSITKIAEKDNYDIVEFKAFTIPNYYPELHDIRHNFFNFHKNNLILHQPELGIFPISRKNSYFFPNDYSIWGKCIKSKIYQSSVRALGEKRYSIYDCFAEDILMIFIMFNIANSFIFVNRYGIFHLLTKTTYSRILPSNHKMFCEIFLMDIIQEFLSQNYKKFAVLKSFDVLRKIGQYKLNQKNKEYLKTILQKILDCKYIKDYYKIEMKKKYSKIIKL